jgi:hypothetical protein
MNTNIYLHDKIEKSDFLRIKKFIDNYLVKQIKLQELFNEINPFINYKNKKNDNIFLSETEVMGLDNIFLILGVIDPEQIQVLKDVFFMHLHSKGTARKRAEKISKDWLFQALEFRDQNDKTK